MNIFKVKGNTFCIDTGMSYIPFYKINNKEIVMLDSGWKEDEHEGLLKVLEENNFIVLGILNSHGHIDHIGNNAYLKSKYNSIIAMPSYEAYICSSISNIKLFYSNETLKSVDENYGHMIFKTDVMIDINQDEVIICGSKFEIIHTPGHSPEHICIITPDEVVYLGDVLMSYEEIEKAKIPYAYIMSEDLKSKKMLHKLKYSKYIVAHKGIYDDIKELTNYNIHFYEQRAEEIYKIIKNNMTMEDIMRTVVKEFDIHINSIYKFGFIERMLKSFIEYLCEIEKLEVEMSNGIPIYIKL